MKYILAFIFALCSAWPVHASSIYPVDLRCEYLTNPLGIDVVQPRLGWRLEAVKTTGKGQKQTAYHILVASTPEQLSRDIGDVWDSDPVTSAENIHITYQGKPLTSGMNCYWKVRVADESGRWTKWSKANSWSMGLLSRKDWKASWIGSPQAVGSRVLSPPVYHTLPDPWFRKTFQLADVPEAAVIYVASIGYHELYINGLRVGEDVLSPSVADHSKRARYVTYSIDNYLKQGENVIALWLGTSWSIYPAYQTVDKPAAPLVLAQAAITLPGKQQLQIVTDASWKTHASPNTLIGYWDAHHFGGEYYDAGLEIKAWNEAYFDDSAWESSAVFTPQLTLSAEMCEPNRCYTAVIPRAIDEVEPGVYRVDMGTNYSGWFQLRLSGNPGDEVKFEFSEWDASDSSYGIHSIYKIGPTGRGTFCNHFNYMTGRWVRISGLRNEPSVSDIKAWMIRPDYRQAGFFECDQPALNEVYRTTMWTYENLSLGNYVVDCPHRERRGYGGDALATTRMALGTYDVAAFYTKWMEDWRDVQRPDGDMPYTAPTYQGGGGPSWSGYCVVLPWEMYKQYGDKKILAQSFPTIKRWLAFMDTKSEDDLLVRWGGKWSFLGDWIWPNAWEERSRIEKQGLALGDTPEARFFNNCIWVHNLELAARMADILGNEQATAYRQRAAEIRKALHRTFFNPEDNSYVNGYQAYLAVALAADIPPAELRAKVWERLAYEIKVKRDGHFWGGITAGAYLFHTLLDAGRNDLLYLMASQEDYPGWINMVRKGPGTFFEDWKCSGSALHSSYLYIGSWFIEALGGIQQPEAGFKHFTIAPWIAQEGPKEVKSHYDSPYGRIVSNWKRQDNKVSMHLTIPPNTTATLRVAGNVQELEAGSYDLEFIYTLTP